MACESRSFFLSLRQSKAMCMYSIGDFIIFRCLVYEVQPWNSCFECSFGYNDECICLAPSLNCFPVNRDPIQFKFVREATDLECSDYVDFDVINNV